MGQTTITVDERTRKRLSDYKRGDMTYDDVLNTLMDAVRIEDVALEQVREHYRRLAAFRGVDATRFRDKLDVPEGSERASALPRARGPPRRKRP